MRMLIGYTADPTLIGTGIRRLTRGQFNHTLLIFQIDQEDKVQVPFAAGSTYHTTEVYFESHWASGVQGPIPISALHQWRIENPRRRLALHGPLPITSDASLRAWSVCVQAAGKIRYGKLQILRNWLRIRFHLLVGPADAPAKPEWTCSELVVRALAAAWDGNTMDFLRAFNLDSGTMDDIWPAGNHGGVGLFESVTGLFHIQPYEWEPPRT